MTTRSAEENRREFKRIHAPIFCRPVGLSFKLRQPKVQPQDISLGGMRIYSDEAMAKGTKLEVELFLQDGTSITCKVEVVWVEALPADAPAKHDVGLKFIDVRSDDQERIGALLAEGAASPKAP